MNHLVESPALGQVRPARAAPSASARSILLVMALGAVLLSAFVGLRLAAHGGDPSAFIAAGDGVTDPATAPAELDVAEGSLGYDGQLFYRLARNPATHGRHEFGIELVRPEYRHQRIGYPVFAWAASLGGRPSLVPWSLIGVNLAAGVALTGFAAAYSCQVGRSAWLGLLVVGWPGYLVAVARDLSEVVAAAFLLAALLALRRRWWGAAAATLAAAALTRETTLLVAVAILASQVLGRLPQRRWWDRFAARRDGPPAWVALVPLAVYGGWRLVLRWWWGPGANAENAPESFLVPPLTDLTSQLWTWLGRVDDPVALLQLAQVGLLVAVVVLLGLGLRDPHAGLPHERVALVGAILFLSMMPGWDRSVIFLRWANDVTLIGVLVALSSTHRPLRQLAIPVGAACALAAPVWIVVS